MEVMDVFGNEKVSLASDTLTMTHDGKWKVPPAGHSRVTPISSSWRGGIIVVSHRSHANFFFKNFSIICKKLISAAAEKVFELLQKWKMSRVVRPEMLTKYNQYQTSNR
jgi:hypothetical protein